MTTLRNVRTLTRYMAWANARIFDAVAALPEGEATKPRRSVFKNIIHTLNHVYVIDLIFQAHLEEREHDFTARNTPDHPPLACDKNRQQLVRKRTIGAVTFRFCSRDSLHSGLHLTTGEVQPEFCQ